jgi:hypothetical protein
MFTFALGTVPLGAMAADDVVARRREGCDAGQGATCFPQVGNGIEFTGMNPGGRGKLDRFLAEHESK